jgi:hypothetical protein
MRYAHIQLAAKEAKGQTWRRNVCDKPSRRESESERVEKMTKKKGKKGKMNGRVWDLQEAGVGGLVWS